MTSSTQGGDGWMEMLPVAALLCDAEVRVRSLNRIARETLQVETHEAVGRRPGEVIHCVATTRARCGEGKPCKQCHLWSAVTAAVAGETRIHREAVIPVVREDGTVRRVFLCSAGPATRSDAGAAVVVLQDITDLQRLPGLIAICAQCKQVRQDDEWLPLDRYVEARSHTLFTHTLCPGCEAVYYRELEDAPPPRAPPADEG